MLTLILFTLIFVAITAPLIVAPLRQQRQTPPAAPDTGPVATAIPSYETALLSLRDLEFDHELGVVAKDDYSRLRTYLMTQAAAALETAGQAVEKVNTTRKEADVRTRRRPRRQSRTVHFCPQCGNPVGAGDRFCTSCGVSLA